MKLQRSRRSWPILLGLSVLWPVHPACAALIVNPPLPITHRVEVQIIQTARDNAAQPATLFGDPVQSASIESLVDAIWAQAGIDIAFLPPVRYNDTFALQGNGGSRPISDLSTILSNASSRGGILNPDPSVINMFFVDVVPGFSMLSENSANGLANVGRNGIAQFVGQNLLGFERGREVIAGVVAHEIGHNLGLNHTATGSPNLMSPSGTSTQVSPQQISAIFQTTLRYDAIASIPRGGTGFIQAAALPNLEADFNRDRRVDAADLDRWKPAFGVGGGGDANGDGDTDGFDFLIWQRQSGSGANTAISLSPVPEPSSALSLLSGIAAALAQRAPFKQRKGDHAAQLRASR